MPTTDTTISAAHTVPDYQAVSPLYPRYLRYKIWLNIGFWLGVLALTLIWLPLHYQLWLLLPGSLLLALAAVLHAVWAPKRYQLTGYWLDTEQVWLQQGAWWYGVQAVAINRIQHAELSQGPLERRLNIARLILYTAGGAGADITIPGLPTATAQQLKAHVLRMIVAEADSPEETTDAS